MRYLLLLLLSFNAYAAVHTVNVTLSDGATAKGFIKFPERAHPHDQSGWDDIPLDWDISVRGGRQPAFEYTPANSFSEITPHDDMAIVYFQADSRALTFAKPDDGRLELLLSTAQMPGGISHGAPLSSESFFSGGGVVRYAVLGCVSDGRACPPVRCVSITGECRDIYIAAGLPVPLESGLLGPLIPVPEPQSYVWLLAGATLLIGQYGSRARQRLL